MEKQVTGEILTCPFRLTVYIFPFNKRKPHGTHKKNVKKAKKIFHIKKFFSPILKANNDDTQRGRNEREKMNLQ